MQSNGNPSEKILGVVCLIAALFFILVIRLWQLQILQGDEYRRLSEENRLRIVKVAAPRGIIYDRNGVPLVKNSPYYSVSINPQILDRIDITALSTLLSMDRETLAERIRHNRSIYEPIRLKDGLSPKDIAFIEARRSDFPGLSIDVDVSREYLFGSVGAHLIGYLGKPNQSQSKDPKFRDVPSDAFIGQWGVERLFDKELRGTPGERVIEVDALGRELRLIQEKPPVRGEDMKLAMDIKLQKEAEEAFGDKTGALVALKPDSGEILALASKPSFDPNLFARGITPRQWEDIIKNPKQPLLNRALQSQYPPGSTFKVVTAIAALEEGVVTPDTKVTCKGGITYGRWHFGCWQKKGHGILSLHRALVESCDVYFYEAGKKLGIDRIASYARELGLDSEIGLMLVKERRGLIPDTKWKQDKKKQPWYLGETFNAAIGQGYVAVTPFQMARLTSIVSNGGSVYAPSILLLKDNPQPVKRLNIKPETFSILNKALFGVVNEQGGTGWAARSPMAHICGKTGTAQVVGLKRDSKYLSEMQKDHAWFISYAPYEQPEIALAVMVEHGGHGGGAAAPIAKRAIEAYLKSSQGSVPATKLPVESQQSQSISAQAERSDEGTTHENR
ncbi:MAG TPA: penicillin-binding protein 2 [Nitrospiraceae bacterium]|jgi:penicillin-binding protein 2|nr:penicillin-binding protein 2 [Nitrospiraceae bacterium]